ncbi:hypothetical protein FHL15_008741 [Xylaria flabelliformis]|uniref:RING-type domain-containing protein n=1 Tax=Xylaria flabelliformis TaxID=2512241 RepID=A0A553HQZ2_9PEZI|nr:hypothetical protein FHL15_008741 [Xylaria flabelliformis]
MGQVNQQINSKNANKTVETNNFHQVLKYFDEAGKLKRKDTRLEIGCQICLVKNLALVNLERENPTPDTHEQYTILPFCGHAFGHQCLDHWIDSQSDWPRCPTCRELIYYKEDHIVTFDIQGTLQITATSQAEEIQEIRAMLHSPHCQESIAFVKMVSETFEQRKYLLPYTKYRDPDNK